LWQSESRTIPAHRQESFSFRVKKVVIRRGDGIVIAKEFGSGLKNLAAQIFLK